MSQRILLNEIDKSVKIKLDKSIRKESSEGGYSGLMTFGEKNDYPQKIEAALQNSTKAKATLNIFLKFLIGQGFEADINNEIIGRDSKGRNVTVKQLLRKVAYDLGLSNGFYVHTDWNAEQKIGSYKHVPFKNCRFAKVDEAGFSPKVLVYDNWSKENDWKRYDRTKIDDYSIFTTDEDSFKNQVETQAGGEIDKYNGQMYFNFFDNSFFYPLSPFDSNFLNMDTEYQVSLFKNRTTRNGFLGKTIMRVAPPESSEEREKFISRAKDFTGVDGAQFFVVEDNTLNPDGTLTEGAAAVFDKVDSNINPDLFQNWEDGLADDIRLAWNVPKVFINPEASLFGTSGELIIQMTNYYNGYTQDARDFLSESFAELFKNSNNPKLANNQDWKIKELSLLKSERNELIDIDTTERN